MFFLARLRSYLRILEEGKEREGKEREGKEREGREGLMLIFSIRRGGGLEKKPNRLTNWKGGKGKEGNH